MHYFLAQFKAYKIIVLTTSREKALLRLIGYVRVTKGNVGYEAPEIRQDCQIHPIDLVDDLRHLRSIQDVEKKIERIRDDFEIKLDKELKKLEETRKALRDITVLFYDKSEEDWWD